MSRYRVAVIAWALTCLVSSAEAPGKSVTEGTTTGVGLAKHHLHSPSISVTEWFARYDQIRRDAEMTTGDKLQSLLLSAKKPEIKNAALASRMLKKYTTALSGMKSLRSTLETRELQQGYIKYFSTACQLFSDYLAAQKEVPFTNQSLVPTKRKLEDLDKTNKKLDAALRNQYLIPNHIHS